MRGVLQGFRVSRLRPPRQLLHSRRRAQMAAHAQTAAKRPPGPTAEEERPRFKICVAKKQAVVPKVHKISQLRIGGPTGVAPPELVSQKLSDAAVVVGLDVETSDWVDRKNTTSKGQFASLGSTISAILTTTCRRSFRSVVRRARRNHSTRRMERSLRYNA